MAMTTPPIIETLDRTRARGVPRHALRRATWIALDLLAIAGFSAFAVQALT
jgi:hypothetical protein